MTALINLAWAIVGIVGTWKVLEKAGKEGWWSLIPFANMWQLYKAAGVDPVTSLLSIPTVIFLAATIIAAIMESAGITVLMFLITVAFFIAYFVFYIIAMDHLAKKFNQPTGFAVGLILVHNIFMLILGFGEDYKYDESAETLINDYQRIETSMPEQTDTESSEKESDASEDASVDSSAESDDDLK